MERNLSILLEHFPKVETGKRFILGIDGLSRSGKTTLGKKLHQVLREKGIPVSVFHIDDYIVERKKRYHTGHEQWFEYYHLQWNVPWLREHFFRKLHESSSFTLPLYDKSSDSHSQQNINLPYHGIVIIEGVFLQRSEWRGFYDFVVYLDCPREKRFARESGSAQSRIGKFKERYWKAEEHYIEAGKPKNIADLVLNN
ncbi:uridine kinase [Marininema mesophilum]|uniref:Uridine kinase n=1 Tax=Marininema mesophilum TaxID=1048340 RepID=A0A1H2Z5B5_9BACL|nr:kinase [Marininema mesophilum]SDX12600.1 uridine kinase [Marininema mesophilum]